MLPRPPWLVEWMLRSLHGLRGNEIALWARNCRRKGGRCWQTIAKGSEINAWNGFKEPKLLQTGKNSKSIVDTRWALAREMVDGREALKARLAAKGYQGPGFLHGLGLRATLCG